MEDNTDADLILGETENSSKVSVSSDIRQPCEENGRTYHGEMQESLKEQNELMKR